jgi:hypothetical protein
VSRANPVRAEGETIVVGGEYDTATSRTLLRNQANSNSVFQARSDSFGVGVAGVSAYGAGVAGASTDGNGVYGSSTSGFGVLGYSVDSTGVHGTAGGGSAGVRGENEGTGLTGIGVHGSHAGSGWGVLGYTPSGVGCFGSTDAGTGVRGHSESGTGLYGTTASGFALRTSGRTKFSTSGVVGIKAGTTSKTVMPGVDVTSSSFVLLTPKTNLGGRALWFTTNPAANTFTIRMSSARSSGTFVAWLLLG